MIVRNYTELTTSGNVQGRTVVLQIIEGALEQVNSYNLVTEQIKLHEDNLRIGHLNFDLRRLKDIFAVGGGKQVTFVASALEDTLGDRVREGVVVEKRGRGRKTKKIGVVEGGHPIPDDGSIRGAEEIVRIAKKAQKDDLVIVCVTGGCTSLTMLPPEGITLRDTKNVFELLLNSGAPLEDMNTVRKHLSQVGGGKLSMLAHPAQVVSLIAVDEIAGVPWGPTVSDTTSFSDARHVLIKFNLWGDVPRSVRNYLEKADSSQETPKLSDFERISLKVHHLIFADNKMLCRAAERRAAELGVEATTISTGLEGEARDVGVVLASIAKEIEMHGRPFKPPHVLVAGGETTVTIKGEHGEGGRNQELALATALKIGGSKGITIASIGSDGTDGPTDIAGAVVDGYSSERAARAGVDLFECLKMHDSSKALKRRDDAIYTNNTGTNLMDLVIVYVS